MDESSTLSPKEVQLVQGAIQFFFRHIRFDDSTVTRMNSNKNFQLFDERRYHRDMNSVFQDSLYETTETHIATFILSILDQGLFSTSSFIGGIVFLSRFKEATKISLHTYSWRLLFLTSILLADKCLEEKPIRNESLSRLFPVVSVAELARLELEFACQMDFKLFIRAELYNSFVDKLINEKNVSKQIELIVQNSDFMSQFILPNMKTLTHTPDLLPPQSATPITVLKESRGRQLSRVISSSSFIDKTIIPQPAFSLLNRRRSPSISRVREEHSSLDQSRLLHVQTEKKYPISSLTKHRRSPSMSRWNNTF